jgi:hypothetical protein
MMVPWTLSPLQAATSSGEPAAKPSPAGSITASASTIKVTRQSVFIITNPPVWSVTTKKIETNICFDQKQRFNPSKPN